MKKALILSVVLSLFAITSGWCYFVVVPHDLCRKYDIKDLPYTGQGVTLFYESEIQVLGIGDYGLTLLNDSDEEVYVRHSTPGSPLSAKMEVLLSPHEEKFIGDINGPVEIKNDTASKNVLLMKIHSLNKGSWWRNFWPPMDEHWEEVSRDKTIFLGGGSYHEVVDHKAR